MRSIFPLDLSALADGATTHWLSGEPGSGEACSVRVSSLPPAGGANVTLQSFGVDRFCFVLCGEVEVRSNAETYVAPAEALLYFPAGLQHAMQPSDGSHVQFVEVFAPGLESGSTLTNGAQSRIGKNFQTLRRIAPEAYLGTGFAYQPLVDRKTDSNNLRMNIMRVQPGASSPEMHIHAFDQFYFILEGTMRVVIGRQEMDAPKHTFVRLPAGVVHKNWNASGGLERHIALLVPEPMEGEVFDYAVDIHEHEAKF